MSFVCMQSCRPALKSALGSQPVRVSLKQIRKQCAISGRTLKNKKDISIVFAASGINNKRVAQHVEEFAVVESEEVNTEYNRSKFPLFDGTLKAIKSGFGLAKIASLLGVVAFSAFMGGAKQAYAESSPQTVPTANIKTLHNEVYTVSQEEAGIDSGDTAWILTSTALVLFMTIPGLSLFYAGLVRQRNVLSVLMHCFSITAMMTVLWTVAGYSLSFSTTGMQEGVINTNSFLGNLDKAFLNGVTEANAVGTIPEFLWFTFQMTFAIITPALMVGAFAERMKFSAMMLFVALFSFVVYFPVCHMVWSGPGAFFGDMGVLDFAGGIVVHITAGIAALLACVMVGPRKENKMVPHNLPMTVAGTGMLWVGWYGFNAGSAAAASAAAAQAMVVTQISAATAAMVWMFLDWQFQKKPTMLGMATGSIAGLAAITPASGFVGVPGALVIGTVSAIICRWFALSIKDYFGYDDSLDVFGVHGIGGFIGTILVGIFGSDQFGGNQVGMSIANQLGVQTFAATSTAIYTLIASYILIKIVASVCGGLRVSESDEANPTVGVDGADFGEAGYIADTA
eukprot:TRINITY_DN8586_c0_g1_i3.p1 TRINITY_DN8586_c0_g1~~TRINITY_DN8586_c0_g1_i3.p1  ORF type:complete len:590 (+),score=122.94 TRINITY_DN8586_c0_g1_i3:68-1771(+)